MELWFVDKNIQCNTMHIGLARFLPDLVRLVKANIFRDLPPCPPIIPFEECDPDNVVSTEWDNLNNVYKV